MINLYITSSNKGEGKTFLTGGLAATMQSLGYTTSVYKPIQTGAIEISGFMQSPDITFVKSIDPYINTKFTYLFKSQNEPLIASELERVSIDQELIINDYANILKDSDCTIIDGDSGILSPLGYSLQTCDLIRRLQLPMLLVVTPNKNCINNALTTLYTAQEKGISIRGVVINDIKPDTSKEMLTSITRIIEEYTNTTILGLIPHIEGKIVPEELISAILNGVDIENIFGIKIEKLDLN